MDVMTHGLFLATTLRTFECPGQIGPGFLASVPENAESYSCALFGLGFWVFWFVALLSAFSRTPAPQACSCGRTETR